MNILRTVLLILHFIGLGALLGGFFEQIRAATKNITTVMVWGARAQVVTGLALAALLYANDDVDPDHAKLGTKLVIALAIAGVAEASAKKTGSVARAWWIVGVLTVLNIAVAVAWR